MWPVKVVDSAALTDEGAEPDQEMGRLVLLAVDAILIERVASHGLLQEHGELFWLGHVAGREESNVVLWRGQLFDWLLRHLKGS